MPNKVPLDVPRELRYFFHEFIDIVLSKLSLPALISRKDVLYGLGLRDCHQATVRGESLPRRDYIGDAGLKDLKVLSYLHRVLPCL